MTKTKTKKTKAYSYLRFATPEQSKGDSFRRQAELSERYADNHNLELDNSLAFQDLGVSAFKGKNSAEGALGAFHNAVDEGRVAKGSYLLVESLDRLSRETAWTAANQLESIVKRGIVVVTLQDDRKYTHESFKNPLELIVSLMVMARAHEESATKSKRLSQAWANKRKRAAEQGHKLTSLCPAWLELVRDKNGVQKFEVIKERAAVVRRIYDMMLDGLGKRSIARMFNEEGIEPFGRGNGWHDSYIQKISENEAVCGTFQPHRMQEDKDTGISYRVPDGDPIHNYFPAIIDRPTYLRTRAERRARIVPAGNRGKNFSNLFVGFVKCGSCGAAMHYVNKGEGRKGGEYLACSSVRRKVGDCKMKSWRYPAVEQAVLMCASTSFTEAVPEIAKRAQGDMKALQDEQLELEDDIERVQGQIEKAMDILLDTPSDALKGRLSKLEGQKADLQSSRELLDTRIQQTQSRTLDGSNQDVIDEALALLVWMDIEQEGDADERYHQRAKLSAAMKRQGITITLTATVELREARGDTGTTIPGHGFIQVDVDGQPVGGFLLHKGQHDGIALSWNAERGTWASDGRVWPLDEKGEGYAEMQEEWDGNLEELAGMLKETG